MIEEIVQFIAKWLSTDGAAGWASAAATFISSIVALYLGLSSRNYKLEVSYKTITVSSDSPIPESLTLFVANRGYCPAYIIGTGFYAKISCPGCACESYDGKRDTLEPNAGGEVKVSLGKNNINYITNGLIQSSFFGFLIRKGFCVETISGFLARRVQFYIITSDGRKHLAAGYQKGFVLKLEEALVSLAKTNKN